MSSVRRLSNAVNSLRAVSVTEKDIKGDVDLIESASSDGSNFGYDEKREKALIRKIDRKLLPLLTVLYLLSFLDRTNIGNARLFGLEKDLGMKGLDYNVALAIFYPTYILIEIPSNMMLKKWTPSKWIATIMVAWAIVTTLMGIVQNYHGLLAARIFLGLAEGGLFPGVAFLITTWYRRHECGFRIAIFFSAATAAGAFGGLIARGVNEMQGVAGLEGWRWLFILEGLITFVFAIIAWFFLHDYPDTAKFLSTNEKAEVKRRLTLDASGLATEFNIKFAYDALKDWKIWVHMCITIGVYTCVYSVALFLPTIVRTLGYTNAHAQLMTVPPYVVACVCCVFTGWAGDKTQQRGLFMMGGMLLAIVGLLLMLFADTHHANQKYAGVFLFSMGVYPNVAQGAAWQGNNNGGTLKRGVAMAMHVGFGNAGGIIASFVFLPKDSPRFRTGLLILIGLQAMSFLLSGIMTIYYRRENARRDALYKAPEAYTQAEKELEREKGDYASFFRFTV